MEDNISLGKMLSNLRNNMGLTQEDIANKIHVRKAVVEEIENDQRVHAPLVFVKGYIRSYAEIVGLSEDEYQPYLEKMSKQNASETKIKQLIPALEPRKRGKRILFFSLFVVVCIVGVTIYSFNKESKNNYVEVSHYISPSSSNHVNS